MSKEPKQTYEYVILPEKEGFRRMDRRLQDLSDNPTNYTPRDQRKERLCPVCNEYKPDMRLCQSRVYGKPLSHLRQQFRSPMPMTEGELYCVCCTSCADLLEKIDRQKGHRA